MSADYFGVREATRRYIGSMRVDRPVTSLSPTRVTITGDGVFTWRTSHTRVTITIPCARGDAERGPATLRHVTAGGSPGATYRCAWESEHFRTVQLVESRERSVVAFTTYDTGLLPSGGPARSLSAVAAFAEAGVEAVPAQETAEVDSALAGADAAWSDAELHAAMQLSFSRWMDRPQWAVWLLHARLHEDPGVFGLMFDRQGLQRQGCAVFYHDLAPTAHEFQRELLRVCVHEIGHAFNLPHCWQQTRRDPEMPARPGACSWMNYPERFPGGAQAFWSGFGFEFDDIELVHLRHAFRDTAIMGGAPFVGSAASTGAGSWAPERRDPGLRLRISAPATLPLGVPVTVGLELSATDRSAHIVPRVLGPRPATVDVAISDPRGNEVVFEPLLHHCRGHEHVTLSAGDAPIRDFAFVHYGRDGFAFEAPGTYRLRARYTTIDGSAVVSDELAIRVRPPGTPDERAVAELVGGHHEVGMLMSLMGSDSHSLGAGNATLRTIIERYPAHPVADIARVLRGANLARAFKLLQPDGTVILREAKSAAAMALVDGVVDVALMDRRRTGGAAVAVDIATRQGVAETVHAFVNSRRSEINATVRARFGRPTAARAPLHATYGFRAPVAPHP